ncbi:MAG: preprotein translocase subunit SecE [Patescibacteria group bacterium]
MNFFRKIVEYLRDSIGELKKVTWPTKKQVQNYTLAVIALSAGLALFFAFLDYIFNLGVDFII